MEKVVVKHGPYKNLIGDAVYFPNSQKLSVSFPSFEDAQLKELFSSADLKILGGRRPSPILAIKENINLRYKDEVQLIAHDTPCSSVWCKKCFKYKGGSQRISERLRALNWKKTRQIILTVDPKKFSDGQDAYETLKEKGATHQLIHNLKRTSNINILDWVWILEWHKNGFPHWHLFAEVDKAGKAGMIGNQTLLQHWGKYGIVREKPILSEKHWDQFTNYFGNHGYFGFEKKDKSHQLDLPDWAKQITYRIRKTSSMRKPSSKPDENFIEDKNPSDKEKTPPDKKSISSKKYTYEHLLNNCGQQIMALVRRDESLQIWRKYDIPYKMLIKQYSGEYIKEIGYVFQMDKAEFWLFEALYALDYEMDESLAEG